MGEIHSNFFLHKTRLSQHFTHSKSEFPGYSQIDGRGGGCRGFKRRVHDTPCPKSENFPLTLRIYCVRDVHSHGELIVNGPTDAPFRLLTVALSRLNAMLFRPTGNFFQNSPFLDSTD